MLERITIEENSDRTKITVPLKRDWPFWITYTTMLIGWVGGTIWSLSALLAIWQTGSYQQIDPAFLAAYVIILVLLAGGWYWVGKKVWRGWQYNASNREILFFYSDKLIVRRPVSLLGVTEAYDMQYVTPFRFDEKVSSLTFDYGTYRVPVGGTLSEEESSALGNIINDRFFPNYIADDYDDDDDEL